MNNTIQLRNTTGDWAKHLRPFGKRVANKKERASGRRATRKLRAKKITMVSSDALNEV